MLERVLLSLKIEKLVKVRLEDAVSPDRRRRRGFVPTVLCDSPCARFVQEEGSFSKTP